MKYHKDWQFVIFGGRNKLHKRGLYKTACGYGIDTIDNFFLVLDEKIPKHSLCKKCFRGKQ